MTQAGHHEQGAAVAHAGADEVLVGAEAAPSQVVQGANGVAEGFVKYGPYIWGLSLALVALGIVSILLLRAKNREIDRSEKREAELLLQLAGVNGQMLALQEKRIADRDTFQGKLDALARETNATSQEVVEQMREVVRQLQEHQPRRRAKEGGA